VGGVCFESERKSSKEGAGSAVYYFQDTGVCVFSGGRTLGKEKGPTGGAVLQLQDGARTTRGSTRAAAKKKKKEESSAWKAQ